VNDEGLRLALVVGAIVLVLLAFVLLRWHRARRQARTFHEPFPHEWRTLLERRVPLYARMPRDLRLRLEPAVRAFLARIEFIGCQGLQITDEMRLVVATQASLLVVENDAHAYTGLHSVLLYPDEFVVKESDQDEAGVVTEGERVLSGQTFDTARIILSWRDVQESGAEDEAYNVVLHEFAHYLDHSIDSALTERGHTSSWHETLEREYDALCDAVERGEATVIDPYGAEHLAEFFAVATETFFEQPLAFRETHPRLYEELRDFFKLDPSTWRSK
jgi:Mlc titration factor MtfA (ptsG expression regulator)